MKRPPRTVVTPYREVVHDLDDDGYLDAPTTHPLDIGIITTLPVPPQEKARIRRQRPSRPPFGFQA